jgi:hypothetical protein
MAPQPLGAASAWDEEEVSTEGSPAASRLRHRHAGKGANDDADAAAAGEPASVERVFADRAVPLWREQLTFRALAVSALLAVMFSVIVMKLNLTTGIIPSLNVSAGLLGFFFVRMWTAAVERMGLLRQPFTRQENTVIQTCVVSAYGIAFSGTVTTPVIEAFKNDSQLISTTIYIVRICLAWGLLHACHELAAALLLGPFVSSISCSHS